jgi:hypothetical protein
VRGTVVIGMPLCVVTSMLVLRRVVTPLTRLSLLVVTSGGGAAPLVSPQT